MMRLNAHQNADSYKQNYQRCAAVTHKRQRNSYDWQNSTNHSHIYKSVSEKSHRYRRCQ